MVQDPGADMIKRAIKQTFASHWGWRILGPVLRKSGVIVLMYHRILGSDRTLVGLGVEEFASQMAWLREKACTALAGGDESPALCLSASG